MILTQLLLHLYSSMYSSLLHVCVCESESVIMRSRDGDSPVLTCYVMYSLPPYLSSVSFFLFFIIPPQPLCLSFILIQISVLAHNTQSYFFSTNSCTHVAYTLTQESVLYCTYSYWPTARSQTNVGYILSKLEREDLGYGVRTQELSVSRATNGTDALLF